MKRSFAPSISIVLAAALVVVLVWLVTKPAKDAEETGLAEAGSGAEPQAHPTIPPPIVASDETSTPEREVVEVETETTSVVLADGRILVRGTLVVVDPRGVEHREEDGECRVISWKGDDVFSEPTVPIVKGRFELVVEANRRIEFRELTAGDRITRIATTDSFVVDPASHVELRGYWLESSVLRIVDAETRTDLSGITVVYSTNWEPDRHTHPGYFSPKEVLFENAVSPLTISPEDCELGRWWRAIYVWARAPGFAWGRTYVSFKDADGRVLALVPEAELEITLLNYQPPPPPRLFARAFPGGQTVPELHPVLRVRDLPPEFEGRAEPDLDLEETLRIVESMPEGDVDPLGGEPRVEGRPLPRRPTLVTGLAPGPVVVSAEIGGHRDEDRIVLAWKPVELEAGKRTSVTLELDGLPDLGTPVPFAGTLYLPEAWEERDVTLSLEPMDLPYNEWDGSVCVSLDEMEAVAERPGLYRWSAGEVLPGRYEATIWELELGEQYVFDVNDGGLFDAHIGVGEQVQVVVRIVDATTEEPADLEDLFWRCKRPGEATSSGERYAERDPDTGVFRFWAPVGRVHVSVMDDSYAFYGKTLELQAGTNEITIPLEKLCGIVLSFRNCDQPLPFQFIQEDVEIVRVDGSGRVRSMSGGGRQFRVNTSNPGLYEIRIGPIDGYQLVPTERVQVPPGEFVDHVVALKRIY